MVDPIGPILAEDVVFTRQIAETFANVGSTDLSWTEKVRAMARDGSPGRPQQRARPVG